MLQDAQEVARCFGGLVASAEKESLRCVLKDALHPLELMIGSLENKHGGQLFCLWEVRLDNVIPPNCPLLTSGPPQAVLSFKTGRDAERKICCRVIAGCIAERARQHLCRLFSFFLSGPGQTHTSPPQPPSPPSPENAPEPFVEGLPV